jgi:hypothetical protein
MSRIERKRRTVAVLLVAGLLSSFFAGAEERPAGRRLEDRAPIVDLTLAWERAVATLTSWLRPARPTQKNGGSLDPWGRPSETPPPQPTETTSAGAPVAGK